MAPSYSSGLVAARGRSAQSDSDTRRPDSISSQAPALGWWTRRCRSWLHQRLSSIAEGELHLSGVGVDASHHGDVGAGEHSAEQLQANVVVQDARFYRSAVEGGALGLAESYLRGEWDVDDLTALFRIFLRNRAALEGGAGRWRGAFAGGSRWLHWLRDNTLRGSRRNIAAHYDLGNDFYRLWLDETLAYSSAIFPRAEMSLADGSREKFDRICRKLELSPRDHVLEIGAGWGGFALHAAEHFGCEVTTTTISKAQWVGAAERFRQSASADRITLLDRDYRLLEGTYDKLVSIEMIEAVGFRHFDDYFRQCGRLLKPGGTLVLQAIVLPERRYHRYLRSVDFIQRYVFPGGCLPSVAEILASVGRTSDLRFVHMEDFAPHYAETLRRWRIAFTEGLPEIRRLGYSERLIRTWRYYLSYCEAAFAERVIGVVQMVFDQPNCRRDPVRLSQQAARFAG